MQLIRRTITFKKLIELSLNNKIYVDHAFQRKGGFHFGSGWSNENFPSYIVSTFADSYANSVTLINIRKTIVALIKQDSIKHREDIKYLQHKLDDGFEYISVDGNNTTSCIYEFYKNSFEYAKSDDESENYFRNLPQASKDNWLAKVISLNEIEETTIEQACDLFRNMNLQTSLNHQERRQARITSLASTIREMGDNYKDLFSYFLYKENKQLDNRMHEAFIAQIALHLDQGKTRLVNENLDEFYQDTNKLSQATINTLNLILNEMQEIAKEVGTLTKGHQLSKGDLFSIFFMLQALFDKKYKIIKRREFFSEIAKEIHLRKLQSKKVTKEDEQEKSYTYWTSHYYSLPSLPRAKNALIEWFVKNSLFLENRGLIEAVRTHKDTFSAEEKREATLLQNEVDRQGNPCLLVDTMTGKTHGDHVISVKNGGETKIENLEVMFVRDNLKKGANNNEPHFPHQQNMFDEKMTG